MIKNGGDFQTGGIAMDASQRKARTIGEVFLSANWSVVAGLAFTQSWITVRWFSLADFPFESSSSIFFLMGTSCLVATIVLLLCALFSVRLDRVVKTRRWLIFVGVAALVAALFIPVCDVTGLHGDARAILGGILSGIGSSVLLLSWFVLCVECANVINYSLGFLLAALISVLFALLDGVLPHGILSDVGLSIAPVVCSLVFLGVYRMKLRGRPERAAAGSTTMTKPQARYFIKACTGVFLVGLANELVRFANLSGPILFSGGDSSYLVTAVVLVLINFGIARQLASEKPSSFFFVCRGAMMLSIAGAFLYPYVDTTDSLVLSISVAGRQCVQLLVWIVVFLLCQKYRLSSVRLFGGMCGVWYLGSFLGMALYYITGQLSITAGSYDIALASVLAVLLLVVAFGLMFSEKDGALLFEEESGPKWKVKAFTRGCEQLIETGRLTKRESEVFWLLAKGASVSHIEEKLYISSSTVATHMKHIYQKLGIHSRKELFDLVERSAEQCIVEGGGSNDRQSEE